MKFFLITVLLGTLLTKAFSDADLNSGTLVQVNPGEILMFTGITFEGGREQAVLIPDIRTGQTLFNANNYSGNNQALPWIIANSGVTTNAYLIICLSKLTPPVGSEPWWNINGDLVQTPRSDPNGPFLLTAFREV